ncbi:hypothetical protein P0Y35_13075 [Kiritimatiellaeota bacterium B1221]|nr:hypothetical protein [Kiritimatiellaeota bacterium B1221]
MTSFDRSAPYSSFLPGIAGLYGKPLWLYFVNRGQAVACFGTQDKDHAIMPFQSAFLHQARVEQEGFRTLVRWQEADEWRFYEPFRAAEEAERSLDTTPSRLFLSEEANGLGMDFEVSYTTVPGETCPCLLRSVTLHNRSDVRRRLEILDGFSRLIPYGLTHAASQNEPFVSLGYLKIDGLEEGLPFYRFLDAPSYDHVIGKREAGNFYFTITEDTQKSLPILADGDCVFGEGGSLALPLRFARGEAIDLSAQKTACMTASAFSHHEVELEAGASVTWHTFCGSAETFEAAREFRERAMSPGWVARKQEESDLEVDKVLHRFFMHGEDELFNQYIPMTFLDNVLRGGLPMTLSAGDRDHPLHVYNRVHGDLERDYNCFSLSPTYFSQGNGHYRDVNQNRRNDIWFHPDIGAGNLRYFFNLLRLDGFNPMECLGVAFRLDEEVDAAALVEKLGLADPEGMLEACIRGEFTVGALLGVLEKSGGMDKERSGVLENILAAACTHERAEYGTGFWIDHWFYCFDHLDRFGALFPDRLEKVLLHEVDYSYWDDENRVLPRAERYLLVGEGLIHQMGQPLVDPAKKKLLAGRRDGVNRVRCGHGKGRVYTTNLLEKILCLMLNKAASIAPSGFGLEMEAGHPGWLDSLNRLPYMFGSSTSELFQLLRAVRMISDLLKSMKVPLQCWPRELCTFFEEMAKAVEENSGDPMAYWRAANDAKEAFRAETWMGLSGGMCEVEGPVIQDFLTTLEGFLVKLAGKVTDKESGLPQTYFLHKPEGWTLQRDGEGEPLLSADGYPRVTVPEFTAEALPLFLEAPVHALRICEGKEEAAGLCEALRASPLFDPKLKMYILGDRMTDYGAAVGRLGVWTAGWFENENVFLHMEHKLLVSMLESGQYERLFECMRDVMVPFQPPERYGRSPLENTSFITSSRHPYPERHGRGYQPRSSGTTAEVLDLFLRMCFGERPFRMEGGELVFELAPCLPSWIFTRSASECEWVLPDGNKRQLAIEENSFTVLFLGKTLVTYHNPEGRDLIHSGAGNDVLYRLCDHEGEIVERKGSCLKGRLAQRIREGGFDWIERRPVCQ